MVQVLQIDHKGQLAHGMAWDYFIAFRSYQINPYGYLAQLPNYKDSNVRMVFLSFK